MQLGRLKSHNWIPYIMKKEASCFSKWVVPSYQTARFPIPEDHNHDTQQCVNFRFHSIIAVSFHFRIISLWIWTGTWSDHLHIPWGQKARNEKWCHCTGFHYKQRRCSFAPYWQWHIQWLYGTRISKYTLYKLFWVKKCWLVVCLKSSVILHSTVCNFHIK